MILVVGATGMLGGMITQRLLDSGQEVRILVRPGSDYAALTQAGARPVTGDLKDPASLDAACAGVNTVITTANSAARGGDDTVETVELQGNRNLIDAAKAAGVQQFIFTSALGAASDSPVPFLQAKAAGEEHLRASGMGYTILQPNLFMDVWFPMIIAGPIQANEPVTLVGSGERQHSFVAADDVAAFATAAVGHPAALDQTLVIGGPEPVSWRDVVAIAEGVSGRSIPVQTVAAGEPIPGLPPLAVGLLTALDTYDSPIDMTETADTFGVDLTSPAYFLRRLLFG